MDVDRIPLGELVAMLSLAADLALGQPMEAELRSGILAHGLGVHAGLAPDELRDLFYISQLRFIGCTAHAHEVAELFGDEIAFRAKNALLNNADPGEVLVEVLRSAGAGRPFAERLRLIGAAIAGGKQWNADNFRTSCEVAREMVTRLGAGDGVRDALWFAFERFDGKGVPAGARGDEIPRTMRIVHLAQDLEAMLRAGGVDDAVALGRKRRGKAYDPDLVDLFADHGAELAAALDMPSAWRAVLATEPEPRLVVSGDRLDEGLRVVADFADLKSPFTAGHSRGVADLAADGARAAGLSDDDARAVQRAGWLHDLGRAAVPNTIWDKPGRLTDAELERVRLHPYFTERVLSRVDQLSPLGELAGCHHERCDGSGYFRSLKQAGLEPAARILAAADVYHALLEDRAHRPATTPELAAAHLRGEVDAGRLDGDAVAAVLEAAGHRRTRRRTGHPAGLTDREVEVLRVLAQGLTTKQIAERLVISAKTADHHIQHIYTKIGVSTRGAAALFAMQHDLVDVAALAG